MIRYIIEEKVCSEYITGTIIICEERDRPKTFVSEQEAFEWLSQNVKDFDSIPKEDIANFYNIKPYVI